MARGHQALKSQKKNLKARNAAGQTPEERAAAKKKVEADKAANQCAICKQTFLVSATDALLFGHVTAKHDKESATPEKCFARLKGYDPNAPCPPAAPEKKAKKVEPKKKKGGEDLSALLSEGLAVGGKKKK